MRRYPGFLSLLTQQLEELRPEVLSRISKHGGLEIQDLLSLLLEPKDHSVDCPDIVEDSEIFEYANIEAYNTLGSELIGKNAVALCVLAGCDSTSTNLPKCMLNIFKDETLLSQKIRKNSHIKNIWVLVTESIAKQAQDHLENLGLMREGIKFILQYESIRLSPDNQLFSIEDCPSLYPCGHGDTVLALEHSGILKKFIEAGGKHIVIINADNVAANVDDSILGLHHANNVPVTCEVVKKSQLDKGGLLCKINGVNQIVEEFRMTHETDTSQFQLMNTNTMILKADLDFNAVNWRWHRIKKNLNGRLAVQYERLLQQLTEHFRTQFVEVQRNKRFISAKNTTDFADLKFA